MIDILLGPSITVMGSSLPIVSVFVGLALTLKLKKWKWKCLFLSHVRLFVIPWTVAHQAPLSMEFSRQEYWSGWPPSLLPPPWFSHTVGGSVVKNLLATAGGAGSIPGLGRSPGEGNGNAFQYSSGKSHGQRSLVGYSPRGCKSVGHDLATKQQ